MASATVSTYDLGVRQFPQPLPGRFQRMPIRLWGALAVPAGKGPFPVVVIAHGAADTGCPAKPSGDANQWPCWGLEQRNDLGFRYLARELAARGFLAIAPDVNAAFTDGWGEPLETFRYGQVLAATVAQLARANRGGREFGRSVEGKVDLARLGVLGHSRGGPQVMRWASERAVNTSPTEIASGRGRVSAILLLEPTSGEPEPATPPDVPLTVVLGQCDGDVGLQGNRWYQEAIRGRVRRAPAFKAILKGANHAFFNTTWTAKGQDDGRNATNRACRGKRLSAPKQQEWLGPVAADAFRQSFGGKTAPWMRRGAPFPHRLAGLQVAVDRLYPRR